MKNIVDRQLHKECWFKAVRSAGKGGQHVNKVSTKVELWFSVEKSRRLTHYEKQLIIKKLQHKLVGENCIRITCQASRSQLGNKKQAIQKLEDLLAKALKREKKRIPTKMPKSIKANILQNKKRQSEKKAWRKKVEF